MNMLYTYINDWFQILFKAGKFSRYLKHTFRYSRNSEMLGGSDKECTEKYLLYLTFGLSIYVKLLRKYKNRDSV